MNLRSAYSTSVSSVRNNRANEVRLTPTQFKELVAEITERLIESQDEMWPLERLAAEKGFSKSYIYHNVDRLGGVKAGGKWFFSKRNIELLIREGLI